MVDWFIFMRFTSSSLTHSLLQSSFQGIGLGQLVATTTLATYYASVMACIGIYFINSFKNPLPWSRCDPEWKDCMDTRGEFALARNGIESDDNIMTFLNNNTTAVDRRIFSSSHLFFK